MSNPTSSRSPRTATFRYGLVGWEAVEGRSVADNLRCAEAYVAQAAERGAQAIGLVEYFSLLGTRIPLRKAAERPGKGAVTRWARESSARHSIEIWCPFVEQGERGRKYNAVAIVDPRDGIVGTCREFHYLALRRLGLDIGEALRVFHRPWGILGCFICFDIHYPEVARVLALQGAQVVFWPTVTAGPWSVESVREKARVRCMDNGFWLIESNVASQPPYAPYAGRFAPGSCVYDPEGMVAASTGRRPGLHLVDIDLKRGSYGSGVIGLDPNVKREDLREGFIRCLRPGYYAGAYRKFSR